MEILVIIVVILILIFLFTTLSIDIKIEGFKYKSKKITDSEKYTVVYSEYFQTGSHLNSIVKWEYLECNPEELVEIIENKFGFGSVWFIFKGHCKEV